jgi:hypothetical protein
VQVLVRKPFLSMTLLLELRTQPLAHPIAGVAVDVPVGFAHRPDAEIVGPTPLNVLDRIACMDDVCFCKRLVFKALREVA